MSGCIEKPKNIVRGDNLTSTHGNLGKAPKPTTKFKVRKNTNGTGQFNAAEDKNMHAGK